MIGYFNDKGSKMEVNSKHVNHRKNEILDVKVTLVGIRNLILPSFEDD
jgi:hypothetical protein